MEEDILDLLTSFLGDYGKQCGEWYSFNCPACAEEKGVLQDNKYNLEVRIDPSARGAGGFHCWRCGDSNNMKGMLSTLFKKYGGIEAYEEFRQLVTSYRQTQLYTLHDEIQDDIQDLPKSDIGLPQGFKSIDNTSGEAYHYLTSRGLTDDIITKYNIGYIGNEYRKDYSMKNRIVIPSYNIFGGVYYWVGRDYTGKSKLRYKNPKLEKSLFAFNEYYINWYEDVTLVEGAFDHIVVPNSIPLLGKSLSTEDYVYKTLKEHSKANVNIFLDDDAYKNACRIYNLLNEDPVFRGRVRIIPSPAEFDPSLIFETWGKRGIIEAMKYARKIDC